MEMDSLKMYFLLKMGIFHSYVSLPEGIKMCVEKSPNPRGHDHQILKTQSISPSRIYLYTFRIDIEWILGIDHGDVWKWLTSWAEATEPAKLPVPTLTKAEVSYFSGS